MPTTMRPMSVNVSLGFEYRKKHIAPSGRETIKGFQFSLLARGCFIQFCRSFRVLSKMRRVLCLDCNFDLIASFLINRLVEQSRVRCACPALGKSIPQLPIEDVSKRLIGAFSICS